MFLKESNGKSIEGECAQAGDSTSFDPKAATWKQGKLENDHLGVLETVKTSEPNALKGPTRAVDYQLLSGGNMDIIGE